MGYEQFFTVESFLTVTWRLTCVNLPKCVMQRAMEKIWFFVGFFFNLAVKRLRGLNKCRILRLQPEMDANVWDTGEATTARSTWGQRSIQQQ